MQFKVRGISNSNHYADVVAVKDSTTIEYGILDAAERRKLAESLQAAIDDLLHALPGEEDAQF